MQDEVSDFELKQALREDATARRTKKYTPWVVALAVALVVGTGGYQFYGSYSSSRSQERAELFETFITDQASGIPADLLASDSGYALVAVLMEAKKASDAGDNATAGKLISDEVGKNRWPERYQKFLEVLEQDIALRLPEYDADQIATKLASFSKVGEPWRFRALLLLAELEARRGNYQESRAAVAQVLNDPGVGDSVKLLSKKLLAALDAIASEDK